MNIREQLINSQPGRVCSPECLGDGALDGLVFLWRTRTGELAPDSESIAIVHKRTLRVLRSVVHDLHGTLHHRKDGGYPLFAGLLWLLQACSIIAYEHDGISPPPK